MSNQTLQLTGERILVVEDEYYIADDVARILTSAGAQVVGPFSTIEQAAAAIETTAFDFAVIDLNLHGYSAVPITELLSQKGKPFAFATGYGAEAVPDSFADVPRIEKPFNPPALLQLIGRMSCGDDGPRIK